MVHDVNDSHWLALLDGAVVGKGVTANEAVSAARLRFPDQTPRLRFHESAIHQPLALSPLLEQLRPLLTDLAIPVYLVGGAVRDAVMNRLSHDLDLAVPSGAIELTFQIADSLRVPAYVLDKDRDVGRIILPDWSTTIDIARFRGPDLQADLLGRDFTLNALALPATAGDGASIIDLTGGLDDIAAGLIRRVQDDSLESDPVRALRAVRQSLKFDFAITPETAAAIEAAAPRLSQVSAERVRDEILNLLMGPLPDQAVTQMARFGLLPVVLPEVAALAGVDQSPPHHEPVLEHTVSVLRWLVRVEQQLDPSHAPGDKVLQSVAGLLEPYRGQITTHLERPIEGGLNGLALLRLGALFHDTGKRETQTIDEAGRIRFLGHDDVGAALASRRMKALAFSNEATESVARITDGHMRPLHLAAADAAPTRRAVYRFYRSAHEAGVDIALLSLADHLATYDGEGDPESWADLLAVVDVLLSTYFTAFDDVVKPVRLLTGSELIAELDLQPGPEVGRLLRAIEEAQAAGTVTTRDEALAFARALNQAQK